MVLVNQPIKTTSKNPNTSQYVSKQYRQNLFSIESNRALTKDPLKLATSYFPQSFHWIPKHIGKDLRYCSTVLFHEKSIFIKPISDKADTSKIIYHSVILLYIVTEEKWGLNPTSTKPLPGWTIPYSYHDYIHAWFKFMLHQDENMTQSWFVNFDKNFNSHLPLLFTRWWTQFGPIADIFLGPLTGSFKYFTSVYKTNSHGDKFPATLHFVKKYKVPWILKWLYVKEGDVLTQQWFVTWWEFSQDVIDNVTQKFLIVNTITHDKAQAPAYPLVQTVVPQPTANTLVTISTNTPTKPSTKTKKKKSTFDGLSKTTLIALLKQQWNDEEEATANAKSEEEEDGQGSWASLEASIASTNPYYPYNQELFSHDEASTPELGEN